MGELEPNRQRLESGLDVYKAAMQEAVKARLREEFRDRWWDDGALRVLLDKQAERITREARHTTNDSKHRLLEEVHIERIVLFQNFDRVFHTVFRDFKETRAWLGQTVVARNRCVHGRGTGDIPTSEVARAIYHAPHPASG